MLTPIINLCSYFVNFLFNYYVFTFNGVNFSLGVILFGAAAVSALISLFFPWEDERGSDDD